MCTTILENIMIFDPSRVANYAYNAALRNVTKSKALNAGINHDDTCSAVDRTADSGTLTTVSNGATSVLGPLCQARGRQHVVEFVPGAAVAI